MVSLCATARWTGGSMGLTAVPSETAASSIFRSVVRTSIEGCTVANYATGIESHQEDRVVNNLIVTSGGTSGFAIGILVQGQYLRIEGNQIIVGDNSILGGYGISFDPGANGSTVIGN